MSAVAHGSLLGASVSSVSLLQVMSAQAQPATPQINGSGGGLLQEAEMEVEAAPSGSGHKPDLVQGQGPMTQTGGGGERSAEDVVMETDTAAPAESTAGQQEVIPGTSSSDPLLFQGSRSRSNIPRQAGTSGDGSAVQGGLVTGMVQGTMNEAVPQPAYSTPRSRPTRRHLVVDAGRQPPPQQSNLPSWVSRLGEFFKAPSVTWLPSPLPSPPMPLRRRQQYAHDGVEAQGPMASGDARSAILGRPNMNNPNSSTPSSSELPTEAIQAEVQRQLGGLIDRLQYMELENNRLQEQLERATAERNIRDQASGVHGGELHRGHTEPEGPLDPLPQADQGRWRDPLSALWGDWSGKGPQQGPLAQVDEVESMQAQAPNPVPTTTPDSTAAMFDILTRSLTQLQDIQARSLQKGLDDEAPEAVKSTLSALPSLPAPEGLSTGIMLQDWLAQVAITMQDISPSSGSWWVKVMEIVQQSYSRWLGATPLERIQLQPQGHGALAEGKWTRVNARACAMLLQSLAESVKQDLIARRVVQSAVLVMFRLHTTYQPGGASEKSLVLSNLQNPVVCETLTDVLGWLRSWPRWIQRCQDLHMLCPDGTVLARTLTAVTARFIADGGDAQFRTQLLRSTLRIDGQPSLEDVKRYHQHLQAELEAVAVSKTTLQTAGPKLKAIGAAAGQERTTSSPTASPSSNKLPCKYFFKATGCRRGQKCPYGHDMTTLSKPERAKKCLCCGSEEHRQRDCPTKGGKAAGRGAPTTAEAPTSAGNSAATPKIHRAEPEGEASPSASASATVVTGEPVWTLETLLQAAAKVSGAKAAPATPNINVIAVRAHRPLVGMMQTYALVDSGATHALRRARSQEEWESARPVVVNLAGGESVSLKMNAAGTILIPMTAGSDDTQAAPIVPLGALVGQLGYTMIWGANRCRLEGRNGEVINLRVRDGCPEIAERDALSLISRLEDNNLEELRGNIRDTKKRIKAAAMMMERTWFDHLQSYAQGGISSEAMKAIDQAPFFSGVPRPCLAGLVEAFPESNGWEALKGLEHLNRRTRKKLWSSNKWIVHMFAGDREKRDLLYLEGHGYVILELDIARGRTQDVLRTATWRVLEYAARKGKIAAVIGGPPQGSFMISRYNIEGPRPLRTNDYPYGNWEGQSDVDVFNVNRQTQLVARMIYLHALATAGRITANPDPTCLREVGFLLEHPRDPRGYLKFGDPLYPGVVSLWRTTMWTEYALEAADIQLRYGGVWKGVYSFDHMWYKPTNQSLG